MITQGGDGTVYLDLTLLAPETQTSHQVPTDAIVVLDRSGSMGDDNKWYYATEAVYSLLDRLTPVDRIALITFDTHARINSRLVHADGQQTRRVRNVIRSVRPGASTNLGDALLLAERIAASAGTSERQTRIILLSDGQANTGIVEPTELATISRRIADSGNVLSTIGMGLGFNETLMASLADHGMGSFNYLEHLESLGTILAQELSDSRQVLAEGSEIRMVLPHGVELRDVAGLPFALEGRTAVIRTGQLFQNSRKRLTTTLQVASHSLKEYKIGSIDLNYNVKGTRYRQSIQSDQLKIACVEPERQEEVLASVDKDVFQDAWIRNNLGAVMRSVSGFVREGNETEAKEAMQFYKTKLEEADALVPGLKKQADKELRELEVRVDEAFRGRGQATKQNRAAKALLEAGQELQREVNREIQ
jgi:Ca-activated chloride channel family protein